MPNTFNKQNLQNRGTLFVKQVVLIQSIQNLRRNKHQIFKHRIQTSQDICSKSSC